MADPLPMEQTEDGLWLVQSSEGDAWYEVDVIDQTCTCPDSRHRLCKHLRQVLHYLGPTGVHFRAPDNTDDNT